MIKALQELKYKLKYFISPVPQPEKWLFIAGCSNSGTSLLQALLSKHPLIGSLPDEGQFCTDQLPLSRDTGMNRLWAIASEKFYLDETNTGNVNVKKLKKQWAARYKGLDKPILLEKSPPNTARLRWLQANFDNAYFIGIIRNGYAVAEGIRRKAGHPVELGARQWAGSNEILLKDFAFLTNKFLITYEELTENPSKILTDICKFISVPPFNKDNIFENVKIHGKAGNISNMNGLSFKNLSEEDIAGIEKEAGYLLRQFNYQRPGWEEPGL